MINSSKIGSSEYVLSEKGLDEFGPIPVIGFSVKIIAKAVGKR